MSAGERELSLQEHLEELRTRLIRSCIALIIGFIGGWVFRRDLLYILKKPIIDALPEEMRHTILLKVIDKFFIDVKVAFIGGLFLAAPYILFQFWLFVAPGLYRHEKRIAMPIMLVGGIFFCTGVLFGYFLVLPFGFSFLVEYSTGEQALLLLNHIPDMATAPDRLEIALKEHIGFTAAILFAFGAAFETPLFMFILGWTGIAPPDFFARKRKFAIPMIFVFAAMLTPPDPGTQVAFAVPLLFLYELGIRATRIFLVFKKQNQQL